MRRDERETAFENPYAAPLLQTNEALVVSIDEVFPQELKPFRTIWSHPRRTIRQIVTVNPELHVVLLTCLVGIGHSLDRASMRNAGDNVPLAAIIAAAIVLGPLGSLLGLWISSHLIRLTGSSMGGVGNREHIKAAIAWANVPAVFALPLWIPQLVLFGSDIFTSVTPRLDAQPLLLIPLLAIALAEFVLGMWSLVLLCNTVAEVQGFRSAWRGLGNLILACAVVLGPLMAIVFVAFMLLQT